MNIGDPAKPYFLDVDTGSDLTWLQCDAPCQSCNKVHSLILLLDSVRNAGLYFSLFPKVSCLMFFLMVWCLQVPHQLYKPTKNKLVPCAASACTTLHGAESPTKKCAVPQQCDYQIKYTDSATSLGVLVADNFTLSLRNSSNIRASLAFG
jgi:hypothetical protein